MYKYQQIHNVLNSSPNVSKLDKPILVIFVPLCWTHIQPNQQSADPAQHKIGRQFLLASQRQLRI
jgi:hypothetical protein